MIFDSQKKGIGLRIFLPELGFANANGHEFMFKVAKDSIKPYSWHHFCFNSDGKSYQVIVDGKQSYQGDHKTKGISMSLSNIFLAIKFNGKMLVFSKVEKFWLACLDLILSTSLIPMVGGNFRKARVRILALEGQKVLTFFLFVFKFSLQNWVSVIKTICWYLHFLFRYQIFDTWLVNDINRWFTHTTQFCMEDIKMKRKTGSRNLIPWFLNNLSSCKKYQKMILIIKSSRHKSIQ